MWTPVAHPLVEVPSVRGWRQTRRKGISCAYADAEPEDTTAPAPNPIPRPSTAITAEEGCLSVRVVDAFVATMVVATVGNGVCRSALGTRRRAVADAGGVVLVESVVPRWGDLQDQGLRVVDRV